MIDGEKTDADTRQLILLKATELFRHYGYNKTSIADIAEACAMSPGNIYRFYRNKQELGLKTVQVCFDNTEDVMRQHAEDNSQSAVNRLHNSITAGVGVLLAEMQIAPKLIEMADIVCNYDNGMSKELENHIANRIALIAKIIQDGVQSGEFSSDDVKIDAECIMIATKVCWDPRYIAIQGFENTERILANQIEFITRALRV